MCISRIFTAPFTFCTVPAFPAPIGGPYCASARPVHTPTTGPSLPKHRFIGIIFGPHCPTNILVRRNFVALLYQQRAANLPDDLPNRHGLLRARSLTLSRQYSTPLIFFFCRDLTRPLHIQPGRSFSNLLFHFDDVQHATALPVVHPVQLYLYNLHLFNAFPVVHLLLTVHANLMALYATASPSQSHFGWSRSQPSSPIQTPSTLDDADDFLSSDFDVSFASTMSITSAPSSPVRDSFDESFESIRRSPSAEPMDISPAPDMLFFPREAPPTTTRPRSSTIAVFDSSTAGRSFGREVSNVNILSPTPPPRGTKQPSQFNFAALTKQKPSLPSQWLKHPGETSAKSKRTGAIFSVRVWLISRFR